MRRRTWTGPASLYLAACLFQLGYTVHQTGRTISLLDNPQPDGFARIQSMVHVDRTLSPLLLAAMAGSLISYLVFLRDARTAVRTAGLDAGVVVRYRGVAVWRVALLADVLVVVFFSGSVFPSEAGSTDIVSIEARLRHDETVQEIGLGVRGMTKPSR